MKLVTTIFLVLISLLGFSQNETIDSLETVLAGHVEMDTTRVNILNELGSAYNRIRSEKALKITEEALVLSEELDFLNGKVMSLRQKSKYYSNFGDFEKSNALLKLAIEEYDKIPSINDKIECNTKIAINYAKLGDWENSDQAFNENLQEYTALNDTQNIGQSYNNLATNQWMQGNKENAIGLYLQSIEKYEEVDYQEGLGRSYTNIGALYAEIGKYNTAIEYLLDAKKIVEETHDLEVLSTITYRLASVYSDLGDEALKETYYEKTLEYAKESQNDFIIGMAYFGLAEIATDKEDFQTSLEYAEKCIVIFTKFNDNEAIWQSYVIQGKAYEDLKQYDKAMESFQMSIKVAEDINSNMMLGESYADKASVYLKTNKNDAAIFSANKNLELLGELEDDRQRLIIHEILSQAYENKKEFASSLKHYKKFDAYTTKILNEETSNDITRLEVEYDYEKEKEITQLAQEKKDAIKLEELKTEKQIRNTIGIGLVLTLLLAATVFYAYNNKKNANTVLASKNEIIETTNLELESNLKVVAKQKKEKEILLKEIHHRVKNNLQLVWSLLDLQVSNIEDEKIKFAINEGKNRIGSMSLIHSMLYKNDDAGNIPFTEYTQKLTKTIQATFAKSDTVETKVSIPEDLIFDIDTSVPLGLIITELFTNSMKYGVNDLGKSVIEISIIPIELDQYRLTVSDNGAGIPADFDMENLTSLGLILVESLSNQLKGSLDIKNNNGAEFNVTFKGAKFTIV